MTKDELRTLLISARKKKRLTHKEVADLTRTGISRQYYGMIESGERSPSVKVAKDLGRVLDIQWTLFFEIDGYK